jgi:hypothetical protein
MHWIDCACAFARDKAGRSIAASMAMMAITTSSSIKVNAELVLLIAFLPNIIP